MKLRNAAHFSNDWYVRQGDEIWGLFDLVSEASLQGGRDYFDLILDHVLRAFDADSGSLFILEPEMGDYPLAARAGDLSTLPWTTSLAPGVGIAGTALVERQPLLIGDPSTEPLLSGITSHKRGLASSLVLPLLAKDRPVGVLCLSRRAKREAFTQEDLTKGRSLASYLALSVSHGKMLREQQNLDHTKRLAEIGQFTASIAHEIRNPLTGIRSAAQMVRSNPDLADEFGAIIETEATRLNALCDEFLAFARPLEIQASPTSLGELVQRVGSLLKPQFDAARVTLVVSVPAREVTAAVDEPRIRQVLTNFAINALQASKPGGRVTLCLSEQGHLSVEDDGQGMDPATVRQLFTPFFTTKPSGTGLGLPMAKKILSAHGAEIQVSSEPNLGSRFEIVFSGRKAA